MAQQALEVLSGHDVSALLTHLLTRPSNASSLQACVNHLQLPVIEAVKQAAERAPDHLKPTYLSLLAPSLSNAQLSALSLHASPRSLAHARSHARQHGAGAMPPKPIQPASKQAIPAHVQSELRQFLLTHSQPAAGRTGKEQYGKHQPAVPIHQLEASVAELYRVWTGEEGRRRMVYSTFRREVRRMRVFKHGRKQTDMCEVCVSGRCQTSRLMRAIMEQHSDTCEYARGLRECISVASSADSPCLLSTDVKRCECVSSEEWEKEQRLVQHVNVYRHHRHLKEKQRVLFKKEEEGMEVGHAQLILDFKENVHVNRGPVEVGDNYYNRSMRSVLGCRLVWKETEAEGTQTAYVNYISTILNKDAAHAIDCLYRVVAEHVPSSITHLSVWTDSGMHFRCAEFACAVLQGITIRHSSITAVHWNVFVEHHGKSPVDAHFSLLSMWLKEAERNRRIDSTEQLVDAWKERAHAHHTQHPVHFHIIQPPCGHDHEQQPLPLPASSSSILTRTDKSKQDCTRPSSTRTYLTIPQLSTHYHYRLPPPPPPSTQHDDSSRHVHDMAEQTDRSSSATPSGSASAGMHSTIRAESVRQTQVQHTQHEEEKKQHNTDEERKDTGINSQQLRVRPQSNNTSHSSSSPSLTSSLPSSLRVCAQVLPCSDWPSRLLSCPVRQDTAPSSLQLAPRISSKSCCSSITPRLHTIMQRRMQYQTDADGDVIMTESQDRMEHTQTQVSLRVKREKRARNSSSTAASRRQQEACNFTIATLPLSSLATAASSASPLLPLRRSSRHVAVEDSTDAMLALMLQQEENAHAHLMYD